MEKFTPADKFVWLRITEKSNVSAHVYYTVAEPTEDYTLDEIIANRIATIEENNQLDYNHRGCEVVAVRPEEVPVDKRKRKLNNAIEYKQELIKKLATYDQYLADLGKVCELGTDENDAITMIITRVYQKVGEPRLFGEYDIKTLRNLFNDDLDKIRHAVNSFMYATYPFMPVRIEFEERAVVGEFWSEAVEKHIALNK